MRYFDTSFIVPLVLPEPTSTTIARFVTDLNDDDLFISRWTQVEFYSMLAVKLRMGLVDATAASKISAGFERTVDDAFKVLTPDGDDFDRARVWLSRFETGLRAGDALHLAIAANRGASVVYCLDKTMITAGRTLGVPTNAGIPLPGYGE